MAIETGRVGKPTSNGLKSAVNSTELRKKDKVTLANRHRQMSHHPSVPPILERDSYSTTVFSEILDRSTHAAIGKFTMGLSPSSLLLAYFDWLTHIVAAPGKRMQLVEKAVRKWMRLHHFAFSSIMKGGGIDCCVEPLPQDRRFSQEEWQRWPFNIYYQSHLLAQQWWHVATTGVPGVSAHRRQQ